MADTKITRLRNLLTPVINYFAIQDKLETGDYPDDKYEKLHELLYKDNIQAKKNLKEVREIVVQIPNDAIFEVNECSDVEEPYYDKKGKEIKEFALLKIYHFFGVNEQGRGRKHYYMYKWVRLKEFKGKMYWVGLHINNDYGDSFNLRAIADKKTRIIPDAEIVQQY